MEQRFKEIDTRLDKVEYRQDRLEKELKDHEIEFAETKIYVKEIYKKMDAIAIALEAMRTSSGNKWEQFFAKALYVFVGIAGSYIVTKMK